MKIINFQSLYLSKLITLCWTSLKIGSEENSNYRLSLDHQNVELRIQKLAMYNSYVVRDCIYNCISVHVPILHTIIISLCGIHSTTFKHSFANY